MTAKILYTQAGTDPAQINWPQGGPALDTFTFAAGQVTIIPTLIGYGDGSITYADGRKFPAATPQGSTFIHQESVGGEA
jgi:hypothetical protein